MQEAVPDGIGGMAAILGLTDEQVIECCSEASKVGIVEPANFNCPGQIVVAGEVKAVEKSMEIAKEKGARRTVPLPVSAPFHCSMLKPAGEMLREALEDVTINDMATPVLTNVTADIIDNKNVLKVTGCKK